MFKVCVLLTFEFVDSLKEQKVWFKENIGEGHSAGDDEDYLERRPYLDWCFYQKTAKEAYFVFREIDKALLFKLTWGGK